MNELKKLRPSPLPTKIDDWDRKVKIDRTLNDYVEELHRGAWDEDESYRKFLEAVWDSDAVEGSLAGDNWEAATILRTRAQALPGNPVATKKKDTIVKALGVVLRRYEFSRKERRHTVKGEVVPNDQD